MTTVLLRVKVTVCIRVCVCVCVHAACAVALCMCASRPHLDKCHFFKPLQLFLSTLSITQTMKATNENEAGFNILIFWSFGLILLHSETVGFTHLKQRVVVLLYLYLWM